MDGLDAFGETQRERRTKRIRVNAQLTKLVRPLRCAESGEAGSAETIVAS